VVIKKKKKKKQPVVAAAKKKKRGRPKKEASVAATSKKSSSAASEKKSKSKSKVKRASSAKDKKKKKKKAPKRKVQAITSSDSSSDDSDIPPPRSSSSLLKQSAKPAARVVKKRLSNERKQVATSVAIEKGARKAAKAPVQYADDSSDSSELSEDSSPYQRVASTKQKAPSPKKQQKQQQQQQQPKKKPQKKNKVVAAATVSKAKPTKKPARTSSIKRAQKIVDEDEAGSDDTVTEEETKAGMTHAQNYLNSLNQQDNMYKQLLEEKEAAFQSLTSQYRLVQAQNVENSQRLKTLQTDFKTNAKTFENDSSQVIEFWKSENRRLEQMMSKKGVSALKEQLDTLQGNYDALLKVKNSTAESLAQTQANLAEAQKTKREVEKDAALMSKFQTKKIVESERLLDYYNLLTAIQITTGASSTDPVNCRILNDADGRKMEFTIDVDAKLDEDTGKESVIIEYHPVKFDVKNSSMDFLDEDINFDPKSAPLFTKHMLATLFDKA
jgi:hypothetical protein